MHYESMDCAKHCDNALRFVEAARPGAWADPDMIMAGNTPCSDVGHKNGMHCLPMTPYEEQTQLAMWSIFAA